jgi:broad specificity phosphatase PhoE
MNNTARTDTSVVTTIDLLRHGECVDGHCYRGSIDVALSEKGMASMTQRVQGFVMSVLPPWQRVISSPLMRCANFASNFSRQHQLPLQVDSSLQEMHFGDWEGQSITYIWQTQQAHVEQWFADPIQHPPPNGEAADVFSVRVVNGFEQCLQQYQGEHLLMVTHGGVMRVLLAHCLSMSLLDLHRFDVPYACLSRLQVITDHEGKKHYRLIAHNMTRDEYA